MARTISGSTWARFWMSGRRRKPLAHSMAEAMRTPLSPGDPRRHHYVPQFYLRRFAAGDQIARVQLDTPDRHEVTNVLNVAVVKDFYTIIDEVVGETVSVERLLAVIDGLASEVWDRVVAGDPIPLSKLDRVSLSLWISMLHVRGPKTRREMEALADHFMKLQLSLIHDEESAVGHKLQLSRALPVL